MSSKKEYEIKNVLYYLEDFDRKEKKSNKNITYTEKLLAGNINKIIQKVGEETVEVLIEAT